MTAAPARADADREMRPYELVIGLECHVELATRSKMFCRCAADWFGAPPNTLTCPVCLGLPGALPVPNRRALDLAITAGIALHCAVPEHTKFDRKNYLYPDLPKGYQISQFDLPLTVGGWLEIMGDDGRPKRVGIRRAHLEEDTGRSMHRPGYTLIDYNRSGVPLLEIVSEPDLSSSREALEYLDQLRAILRYAQVSEFRLEEGAGRFDVNVSIRFSEDGETRWPPQSEIKNLNSFRALEDAVAYESARLWDDWQAAGELRRRTTKVTVGWSPERGETFLQREKEEIDDYRYFPEPDLVALSPAAEEVAALRAALPEMPGDRRARLSTEYGLSEYDARILASDRELADFFEEAARAAPANAKQVANWVMGELLRRMNEGAVPLAVAKVRPAHIAELVRLVAAGRISGTSAKEVFAQVWATGASPEGVVLERGLAQLSDEASLIETVESVLAENAQAVADVRAGKRQAIGALVGAVMKRTQGKADASLVNRLISERLR